MSNKTREVKLGLDPNIKKVKNGNLTVWSHDKNSFEIKLYLDDGCGNPLVLTDGKLRIMLMPENSPIQIFDLNTDSERLGEASFIIPVRLLGFVGVVKATVYVDYDDKTHDLGSFNFNMKRSDIDKNMPELTFYVESMDEALKKADELEEKIKRNDLVTKPELNELEKETDNKLEKKTNNDTFVAITSDMQRQIESTQSGMLGFFDSEAQLKSKYPNGQKGFAVVHLNENGKKVSYNYTYINNEWTKGEQWNTVNLITNFEATNLIVNGDFSNGVLGGWVANNSTHEVDQKRLINTADGSQTYSSEQQSLNGIAPGNKYYLRSNIQVLTNDASSVGLRLSNATTSYSQIQRPIKDTNYIISDIWEASRDVGSLQVGHFYGTTELSQGKSIAISYLVAIDLTKTFGKGKEPSKETMDDILSFFPNSFFDGNTGTLVDNPALFNMIQDINEGIATKKIVGVKNQTEVKNGDGKAGDPVVSIAKNPVILVPEQPTLVMGSNISPHIESWTGNNGAVFDGGQWKIIAQSTIETTINVESGIEYEIDIDWTETDDYTALTVPSLVVSLGNVVSAKQFTGYSDALYKLTLTANETGPVTLKLGDGIEKWTARIRNVIVRKVVQKVTSAGKIGIGQMDVLTTGDSIFIGGGGKKQVTGSANTGYGFRTLENVTTGKFNLAGGTNAGQFLTTGMNNIFLGHNAGRYLDSGYYNILLGYSAGLNLKNGHWNILIGNEAARDLIDGIRNTIVGSRAMNDARHASRNTVMGREAGLYPDTRVNPTIDGSDNVFLGFRSGQDSKEDAYFGVAVGANATTTTNATSIGAGARAKENGSVALGRDSTGQGAQANNVDEFKLGTERHKVVIEGTLSIHQYTPTIEDGQIGDITSDNENIYVKTSNGWKKAALEIVA